MSGLGDAMTRAIKRRIDNTPQPTEADKARQAEEAQRRLGFGKAKPEPTPPKEP